MLSPISRARCTGALALVAAFLTVPAAAQAAPPANDSRTTPQQLGSLPAQVTGTTVEATRSTTDPFSNCNSTGPNVWYRFTAPADGRVVANLQADGDLDAAVDGYILNRSQAGQLSCDLTDNRGAGAVDFTVKKDQIYLVSVSRRANSVDGTFTLTVVAPQPAERPPGPRLAPGGADGTLDRVGNVRDAYSVRMREGRTYRLRLSGRGEEDCTVRASIYRPGIGSFDESGPVAGLGCEENDGYTTYTPAAGRGGIYSVLVTAARSVRTLQRYHLESAGAGPDDLAPGRFLANRSTARGELNGARIDALDLYRFTVAKRSDLNIRLETGSDNYDLLLLNEKGSRVECECGDSGTLSLEREIRPGRYFVAIRARDRSAGPYRLNRVTRVLTRASVGIDKRRSTLGSAVQIGVRVRPSVSGPVTVTIQRFDPLSGWLFYRVQRGRAVNGRAAIAFVPPAVGRWRAKASFDGTIGAGSSRTGFASVLVVAPEAD